MRDPQRTIQAILGAAQQVILTQGIRKMTLEEVARQASISKGGVLHHFATKEAILVGLLESLIARFETDLEQLRVADPEPNGAFTRAFLRAALKPEGHCVDLFIALSSVFRDTPPLLELQRESHARWQQKIESDGIDPARASLVRLAADGFWLARVRGVDVPSAAVRESVIDSLIALTYERSGPAPNVTSGKQALAESLAGAAESQTLS